MSNRLAPYAPLLALLGGIGYCLSLAILLLASTQDISGLPPWLGGVDVALALLVILAFVLSKTGLGWQNTENATRTSYAIFTYLVPLTLAAIWFFREQLILNTFLPGLAWRMYVLFEFLPTVLMIAGRRRR